MKTHKSRLSKGISQHQHLHVQTQDDGQSVAQRLIRQPGTVGHVQSVCLTQGIRKEIIYWWNIDCCTPEARCRG